MKASAKTKAAKKNEKRKQKKESAGPTDATTSGRKSADDVAEQLQSLECGPLPSPSPSSSPRYMLAEASFGLAQDLICLALDDTGQRVGRQQFWRPLWIWMCK